MTTEPKMPTLPEWSKRDDLGGLAPSEIRAFITARDQQWAERVAELERVLDVAREALERCESVQADAAIATIDAARSKEGGGV